MIPVWLIAAIALLGAVCLALPLHIGMTGVCLLLLAAVLLALRILRKKDAPKVWSRILIALTAISMAVIFGAMGYISVQGKDSAMTPDETPDFIVVLGAQVQGDGPSLTLKKRLDKALEFLQAHPDRTVIVSGGQGGAKEKIEAIRACGAVYFGATGGCGALLSQCIKKAEVIAYPDLGPEAVRRLYVENFPVTVIIDSEGNNLYEIGRQNYLDSMRQREACGSGV